MSKLSQSTSVRTIYQHFRFRCGRASGVPIPWKKGLSCLQALIDVVNHPNGVQNFCVQHSEMGAFITELDDESNVAGEWFWMYRINGDYPNVGCDRLILRPFDIINWEQVRYDTALDKH